MCVKKADRIYVMPEAAKKKMQQAKKKRQTVYIYGATCYGKTEFVKQFLKFRNYVYFSCQDYAKILDAGVSWGKNCEILVIDDIYTTGNTIDAVARVLKDAGARKVYFLTISIGQGY